MLRPPRGASQLPVICSLPSSPTARVSGLDIFIKRVVGVHLGLGAGVVLNEGRFFLNTKLQKLSSGWGASFPAGGMKAERSYSRHSFQLGSRKHGCF